MSDKLTVVARSNPFTTAQTTLSVVAGVTVAEIVKQVQPDPILARYAHIYVDEIYVAPELWATAVPEAGQLVTLRVVPQGGEGKSPLATILTVAVMAVAVAYGGPAGAAALEGIASEAVGTAIGTMVVGMAGSLAINAICPPPTQKSSSLSASDAPTLSISGARNRSGAMQTIPKILGEHAITPYYGAIPYTELRGADQYLHMLFILGYGPLDISEHKIGETDLTTYEDYEIEVRQGYPDDEPMKLYPSTVIEDAVGTVLSKETGWVQQTTTADIEEFNIEIAFLGGLVEFEEDGRKNGIRVNFEVEYSLTGEDNWTQISPEVNRAAQTFKAYTGPGVRYIPQGDESEVYTRTSLLFLNKVTGRLGMSTSTGINATPYVPSTPANSYALASFHQTGYSDTILNLTDRRDPRLTVSGAGNFAVSIYSGRTLRIAAGDFETEGLTSIYGKTTSVVRRGISGYVPKGQYDVRVRRVTADSDEDTILDVATWSLLRSIDTTDPVALGGLAKVALVIKATDQLNGVIDQYNCIAKSILMDWTEEGWIEQPTNNPASLYRSVFQAAGMKEPIPDSRFAMGDIEAWAEECLDNGYEYNAVISEQSTPFEVSKDVAAVGRASFAMRDGLYSIVVDSPTTIAAGPKQWLTPRNTWDVKGTKSFDSVHGLEVSYVDAAAGYRPEQVIAYADGYNIANAVRIDKMNVLGITNHEQAYKQARYYLAVAKLRPEMHNRMVDVEHLVCTRGDLIRVTDDVSLTGLMTGRIRSMTPSSGDVETITTDEVVTMDAGKTYALRVRYAYGYSDVYRAVNTVEGETNTFVLSTVIPAAEAPDVGDLLMFGETARETADKLVHHIEMSDNLTAKVYYVDASPAVYLADTGAIPPYDPGISVMTNLYDVPPTAPQILAVTSDETVAAIQDDGSFQVQIMVAVAASVGRAQTAYFECHYRNVDGDIAWSVLPQNSASDCTFYIPNTIKGDDYEIKIRAVSVYSTASPWTLTTHTVTGKAGVVPSVVDLWVENSTGDNISFIETDCHVIWESADVLWNDSRWLNYYLVEVLDKDTSAVLHTEQVKTTRFDLSLEKNQALVGGPYREFKVRVTAYDVFGLSSVPVTIQPVNSQADQITGLSEVSGFGSSTVSWDNSQEIALAGYEIHIADFAAFTPAADTLHSTLGANTNSVLFTNLDIGTYYVKVGAFDNFTPLGDYDLNYSDNISFVIDQVAGEAGEDAINVLLSIAEGMFFHNNTGSVKNVKANVYIGGVLQDDTAHNAYHYRWTVGGLLAYADSGGNYIATTPGAGRYPADPDEVDGLNFRILLIDFSDVTGTAQLVLNLEVNNLPD